MPRLAANLSLLFTEQAFLDRFALAAQAGFKAVEVRFPYDVPAAAIRERLDATGLEMVLFNLPAGDWDKSERGLACLPGREDEFRQGVTQALDLAEAWGVRQLNCLLGIAPPTGHRSVRETLIANLSHAAEAAAHRGITILVEPLNSHENPGYYLSRTRQAIEILDDVGLGNLKLLYDVYHQQVSEGDLARTLEKYLARIGHIQIACPPHRSQPGTGEVDIAWLLGHLDRLGYDGWVGCEYTPQGTTLESLGWAKAWLA
ncbi:putative hydroxypyruvate isomerase [Magnetospirillum sp. LM-5]|uniref:2-oxo-tetronate isomerase n=1 Tax=Magnetospirillum sp. LM-5 TaxID=2681466 RepID=UPI0013810246|nr:2-oxo-tetronate isomerase [Magnetospirillum sp. LM-5]CAA7611463.1 putative hydroxypyruvate isomerase [Magnetospirillum sp. LM-5]